MTKPREIWKRPVAVAVAVVVAVVVAAAAAFQQLLWLTGPSGFISHFESLWKEKRLKRAQYEQASVIETQSRKNYCN